ncbi:MAG: HlyD family efflux transporter periplasmic adaptor subunit [Woeseiaceae bacterium]|nr:HlyD family efflux transporter periplasmic adaptor subunit [Woeseiaceae bacterium]
MSVLVALVAGCEIEGDAGIVGQLASDRVELAAEFAEPVTVRHVVEGERVSAGQLLVEQDTARIEARIREAEAAVGEAEARLAELTRGPRAEQIAVARANLEGARREVAFRETEFERARRVQERELAAPETVDRARAALDAALADFEAAKARLAELLTGTTLEELRQGEQQLAQRRARLDQLEIERRRHAVRAPASGTIDTLLFEPGEQPQPGQPLLVMLTGTQPHARVYVPAADRLRATPGTAVTVHIDGLEAPVPGRFRWVSPEAAFTPYFALTEHDRGRLSYVAKIDLDYDGERLPDGVPVQVTLPAGQAAE